MASTGHSSLLTNENNPPIGSPIRNVTATAALSHRKRKPGDGAMPSEKKKKAVFAVSTNKYPSGGNGVERRNSARVNGDLGDSATNAGSLAPVPSVEGGGFESGAGGSGGSAIASSAIPFKFHMAISHIIGTTLAPNTKKYSTYILQVVVYCTYIP